MADDVDQALEDHLAALERHLESYARLLEFIAELIHERAPEVFTAAR